MFARVYIAGGMATLVGTAPNFFSSVFGFRRGCPWTGHRRFPWPRGPSSPDPQGLGGSCRGRTPSRGHHHRGPLVTRAQG